MPNSPDAIVLFSGGLDSILAAKILESQGLKTLCLHFTSPFFGEAAKIPSWRKLYRLDIQAEDAGNVFTAMLANGPEHGFGKTLNPCVDCKILLLRLAKKRLETLGARVLATGEVIGQRPMSQRKDTLHLIEREAGTRGLLLRPLCALRLQPTAAEESGFVDRQRLLGISGRGRNEQLALAEKFALPKIPAPGGGCLLTERENARRFWQVLKNWRAGLSNCAESLENLRGDFLLASSGRQFWRGGHWLCVGRNQEDNQRLAASGRRGDAILRLAAMPGPLALARHGQLWDNKIIASACALMASYAPKAAEAGKAIACSIQAGGETRLVEVWPQRQESIWTLPSWQETREDIRNATRSGAAKAARVEA